jgi:hypothetical protein
MRISNGTHSVTLLPTYLRKIAPPPAGSVPEVGQILDGQRWQYRLVKALGDPSQRSVAFKADILPGNETIIPATPYAILISVYVFEANYRAAPLSRPRLQIGRMHCGTSTIATEG